MTPHSPARSGPPGSGRDRRVGRRLKTLVEPIAAAVFDAPQAVDAYERLGLDHWSGYFCSRGGCLGAMDPEAAAAVLGPFEPGLVVSSLRAGWAVTTPGPVLAAREAAAATRLGELLPDAPIAELAAAAELLEAAAAAAGTGGRPVFAALRAQPTPADPHARLWRAADLVREHRGDAHTAAWTTAGLDGVEINLLTAAWTGMPPALRTGVMGWPTAAADAGRRRLEDRGLLDGEAFTPAGEALRAEVEAATDRGQRDLVAALGDGAVARLEDLLAPWGAAVVAGGGYPVDPQLLNRP